MEPKYNLRVFTTPTALNEAAASYIINAAENAIAANGRFSISLSGGKTPSGLYKLLASSTYNTRLQWENIYIFWGDERCVPLTDERNNAHQANKLLLDKIKIPAKNIFRIQTNNEPEKAAVDYETKINDFFKQDEKQFDLILLGLGENGHTASIFPGTKLINEKAIGIKAVYVDEEREYRISMTAPLINQAHNILFLVTGISKAPMLQNILLKPYQPNRYPAQLIKPVTGILNWFTDEDAASLLKK